MSDERLKLLEEAAKLTSGDRQEDYGDPVRTHRLIAAMFNAHTGHNITAREAAVFHIFTKLARSMTSPTKRDTYVDIMAYAGIAYECAIAEEETP